MISLDKLHSETRIYAVQLNVLQTYLWTNTPLK